MRIAASKTHMRMSQLMAAFLLCYCLGASAVRAQTPQTPDTHAHTTLIAEEGAYQPGSVLWVGVLFHLDSGWHVYWQNPGDSGTPPRIEWTVPRGFRIGAVRWPAPIRLGKGTVIDYGYENQLLLMAPVTIPTNAIGAASFTADVKYVVCREICIPEKAQLSLALPQSPPRVEHFSNSQPLFQAARKQFPRPMPAEWDAYAQPTKNGFLLVIHGIASKQNVFFFPLDPGVVDNAAPQALGPFDGGFTLTLTRSELLTRLPSSLRGVLNLPGTGAYEITAPITQGVR